MHVPKGRILLPLAAAFVVVAAVYGWSVTSNRADLHFGSPQTDYYNRLVHGLQRGHLYLDVEVPRELLAASDPYDPAKRPPEIALHDVSLYRGHYYIYYGVVPVVLLLLPFRLLAGFDLPIALANLAFALATYALMVVALADLRRRYFPKVGGVTTFLVAVACGMASCLPLLVRRGSMYELPIVSGGCFALAAVLCLYRGTVGSERSRRWDIASSLLWGLAVGCRPTLVIPGALLLLAFLFGRVRRSGGGARGWLSCGAALLLPAAGVGALLAAYNYARFGSPGEFGLRYILSGVYEAKVEHFRLRYLPWNISAYLYAPLAWGPFFPFLHELPFDVARPAQHYGIDHAFGLMLHVPWVWLAVFGWCGGRQDRHMGQTPLAALAWSLLVVAVSMALVLFCFYAAMARYLGDFAPPLALLAGIGAFRLIDAAGSGAWRHLRRIVVGAAAVLSSVVVGLFSLQLYGRVRADNPGEYRVLAAIFDAPVHAVLGGSEGSWGPLVVRLRFPAQPGPNATEELLRTGYGDEVDRLVVTYPDAQHVVFGFEHAGADVLQSAPVTVDRSTEHTLRIVMDSLLPPATWPGYKQWSSSEIRTRLHRLDFSLDGVAVLSRHQRFYDGTGWVLAGAGTPEAFSGAVVATSREPVGAVRRMAGSNAEPLARGEAPTSAGSCRLRVRFPQGAPGTSEPLLVSGETGRADFVAVQYLDDEHLRFRFDHWGKRLLHSEPVPFVPGREYVIEVRHPGYTVQGVMATPEARLEVRVDGRVVFEVDTPLFGCDAADVYVGANPLGGSSCTQQFSGVVTPLAAEPR